MALQDRFTSFVPALSKYGSLTVGCTLLVIGVLGLYENLTEGGEVAEIASEPQPALAGDIHASLQCKQELESGLPLSCTSSLLVCSIDSEAFQDPSKMQRTP